MRFGRTTALFCLDFRMAGFITGVQFQKHTADRVNVFLDGVFAFGLPALEAARLKVGQFLGDADIAQLHALDDEQKAYDRAVRFLGYRPRSQAEVRRNLAQAEIDETVIERVIIRLARQGYLDDAEFARYWVENREQFRPRGARALRQELRGKGLESTVIEVAVGDLDEAASADEAARPRALRLAALAQTDPQAFRHKLSDFLLRRGFAYSIVREVVAQLMQELGATPGAEDAEPSAEA